MNIWNPLARFVGRFGLLTALGVGLAAPALSQVRTEPAKLQALSRRLADTATSERLKAQSFAKLLGIPVRQKVGKRHMELIRFDRGIPRYYVTMSNRDAAVTISADTLWSGGDSGRNLSGTGIKLGLFDAGPVLPSHQELTGRITLMDGLSGEGGDHATHVAGTMAANGLDPDVHGMAAAATIDSYHWLNDSAKMANAASAGLLVSVHPYGTTQGWVWQESIFYWYGDPTVSIKEDYSFGFYSDQTRAWDQVSYDAPFYTIVKAAGDARNQGPLWQPEPHKVMTPTGWKDSQEIRDVNGGDFGYDTLDAVATAKNILVIGSCYSIPFRYSAPVDVLTAEYSAWGPTDDGRIKPDLVANGDNVKSATNWSDDSYTYMSGTSMAAASTAGSLALLYEQQKKAGGSNLRSATVRSLLIHTAEEAGPDPGPDYGAGWGLINVRAASDFLALFHTTGYGITEASLANGQTYSQTLDVNGLRPLKVTIAWTDPAGPTSVRTLNNRTARLVNDLDIRVTKVGGATSLPWRLDPENPRDAATKGDNFRDNVEQILVDAPTAGIYQVTVTHKGASLAPSGSQAFSLVFSGGVPVAQLASVSLNPTSVLAGSASSTGTVTLSKAAPTGGLVVNLASSSANATVPSSVTVAAGQTTATFTVSTTAVSDTVTAVITASRESVSKTANLTLRPDVKLSSISVDPTSVVGGVQNPTGTVTLTRAAPTGGMTVSLASNSVKATVPSSVFVAAGQTTATFTVTTLSVDTTTSVTLTGTLDGLSKTVGLTLRPDVKLNSLNLNPVSVVAGQQNSVGTVSLTHPAPAGGLTIALASNHAKASVASSISIAEGLTSGTFTVTTAFVDTQSDATITASLDGVSKTATLTLLPDARLASVSLDPTSVIGGEQNSVGTVTLTRVAGSGGKVVNLESSNTNAATVPSSVRVLEGATTATFTVTSKSVSTETSATISAKDGVITETATLTVKPTLQVLSLTVEPGTVVAPAKSTGTVTLTDVAPAGGKVVVLATSNTAITSVPETVTVSAGNRSATFEISTVAPSVGSASATISATLGVTRTASLTVEAPGFLQSLSVSPLTVTGGTSATGTVTLGNAAPAGGAVVSLSSLSGSASVPSTVTVPAGQTTATFTVTTSTVSTSESVTLRAERGGITKNATLTISPQITISAIEVNPSSVLGGDSSTGTVRLSSAAGAGGVTVALSSSSTSAAVPSSVSIAEGQSLATFSISTTSVTDTVVAEISGSLNGTRSASLTINAPASLLSLSVTPNPANPSSTATGTLTLTSPAPAGGLTISLATANPSLAAVPSSVTIAAGQTTATFSVTTGSPLTATSVELTATYGAVSRKHDLVVNGALSLVSVSLSPESVVGGNGSTGTVTLSGPAPEGGLTIELGTSDVRATVPRKVVVPTGATSATFAIATAFVEQTARIDVRAYLGDSMRTARLTLLNNWPDLASVTVAPESILGGGNATGTVTLATPAPEGGLTVTLGTSDARARVPGLVVVPAGATSASFAINTDAVSQTARIDIRAYLGDQMKVGRLTLLSEWPVLSSLSLDPNDILGGQSVTGTVTLATPAPVGGVSVTLVSNNPKASVPAAVVVPSGATSATFEVTTLETAEITEGTIAGTLGPASQSANLIVRPPDQDHSVSGRVTTSTGAALRDAIVRFSMAGEQPVEVVTDVNGNYAIEALKAGDYTVVAEFAGYTFTPTERSLTLDQDRTGVNFVGTAGAQVNSLKVSSTSVVAGVSTTGSVGIQAKAPKGGAVVWLRADHGAARVPFAVTIPEGKTSATFTVTTDEQTEDALVVLRALRAGGLRTTSVRVRAPQLSKFTASTRVVAGRNGTGSLQLTLAAPPAGAKVSLTSSHPDLLQVPSEVTVPSKSNRVTFTFVTKGPIPNGVVVKITATRRKQARSVNVTVSPR